MRPLRIGILGCARIVQRGIAEGIRQSGTAELAAIASSRPAVAAQWAADLQIPRHWGSYAELVADPQVDAVYIPLTNELHLPWTVAAAKAGKHVLCEKPLALDAQQAETMVACCQQQGVLLMEAFMWRHQPRVARARQMLAAGELGELRFVKMDFSFDIDRGDWRLDPVRGGGALYDLGCYAINACRLFTGAEPVEVFSRARPYASGVDMSFGLQLVFPGGVQGLADGSFECVYRNRLEIVGTQASIELPEGVLPSPEPELVVRRGELEVERIRIPRSQQYAEEIKLFCDSVAAGKLLAPAENGLANMRVIDRARQQAGFLLAV